MHHRRVCRPPRGDVASMARQKASIKDSRSLADVVAEIRQPVQATLLRAARLRARGREGAPAHLRIVAAA